MSGTYDPVAAAAAAQAAAAAAKAAAEAAAAAAAQAAEPAATDSRTSLADGGLAIDQSTQKVIDETGASLGGVVAEDAVGAHDLASAQNTALAGTTRESLLTMPSLGGVGGAGTGLMSGLPDLGSSFGSNQGPEFGKSMVMDNALADAVGSTPFYADAGTADGGTDGGVKGGFVGDVGGEGFVGGQGQRTRYRYNDATGEVEEEVTGPSRAGEDTTTTTTFHGTEASKVEDGAVKDTNPFGTFWAWAKEKLGIESDDGGTSSTDGGTTSTDGGTTGADAGTAGGDVPAEDAPVTKPKGWIDPDTLGLGGLGGLGTGGIVAGGMGADPNATTDTTSIKPGPQGGDTTVNPSQEGTGGGSGRQTSVAGYTEYDWVGQPGATDLDPVKTPVDAPGQLMPGVDMNTVNPGDGQADTADADAAASTAASAAMAYATTADGDPAADGDATRAMHDPATEAMNGSAEGHGHGRPDEHAAGHGKGHGADQAAGNEDAMD